MEYKASPKRPYLLRAYYDWLVDNSFTPYLVVDATYLGVNAGATGNLQLTNDFIQFNARFKGVSRELYIPMGAALAIYARENGDGVMFEPEEVYDELNSEPDTEQPTGFHEAVDSSRKREEKKKTKSVSHLRIVD